MPTLVYEQFTIVYYLLSWNYMEQWKTSGYDYTDTCTEYDVLYVSLYKLALLMV